MNRHIAVIGSSYGDEGKGLMTDYFAAQNPDAVVVRFNGGANAGHTVTLPDGKSHVFSHISAGSFIGNDTFLGPHFVINPLIFRKEVELFKQQFNFLPKIYASPGCLVTTPYDMLVNRNIEDLRGDNPHGSVGIGLGETLERAKRFDRIVALSFKLKSDTKKYYRKMLKSILDDYIPQRINLKTISPEMKEILSSEKLVEDYLDAVEFFQQHVTVQSSEFLIGRDLIFEGAQGLLLDQHYGYFPHVTRSNTGLANIVHMLDNVMGVDETKTQLFVHYLNRSYTTRHGAGPLENELPLLSSLYPYKIKEKTNVYNTYQGKFRLAPLNFDLFQSIIDKDFSIYAPPYAIRKTVMTCMDHLGEDVMMRVGGSMTDYPNEQFTEMMSDRFDYLSYGPTRNDVQQTTIFG